MNLYRFWDIFFRLFKTPPSPVRTAAEAAEQNMRIAENTYLNDIKLTESMNTESVSVPGGFVETAVLREPALAASQIGAWEQPVFADDKTALQKDYAVIEGAAFPLSASPTLLPFDNIPAADLAYLGQALRKRAEKNLSPFFAPSVKAAENAEAALLSEQKAKRDNAQAAFAYVYPEALGRRITENIRAVTRIFEPYTPGEQGTQSLRNTVQTLLPPGTYLRASRGQANGRSDIGSGAGPEPLTGADFAFTAAALARENEKPVSSAHTEEADGNFLLAASIGFAPGSAYERVRSFYTAYIAPPADGNGTLAFSGETPGTGTVSGAGAVTETGSAAINGTAYDTGYISVPKKELTELREGAAKTERQADSRAEERIIREIRSGSAASLAALNASADIDGIIAALTEAFSQTAETGAEGIYR